MANYTLTTIVDPSGKGTISGGGSYPAGTEVTITATPSTGYRVAGFFMLKETFSSDSTITNDDTYTNSSFEYIGNKDTYNIKVEEDLVIKVNFVEEKYYTIEMTSSPIEGGTVEIRGTTNPQGEFLEGSDVTITATPSDDYNFLYWVYNGSTSGILSTDNPYTFKIDNNYEISAHFRKLTTNYTLRVKSNQTAYGRVSVNGATLIEEEDFWGYSVYSMVEDSQVQLFAIPNTGYQFLNWSNGINVSPYVFIAKSDITISASFEISPIIPQEAELINLNSSTIDIDTLLSGELLKSSSEYTYSFYWGLNTASQSIEWLPESLSEDSVQLLVGDSFENVLNNSLSGTFYLRITATNQEEIFYQENVPFIVNITDDYKPNINLDEIQIHKDFNGKAIAGYSTFSSVYHVSELPSNNSATIKNTTINPNKGYCEIIYPNIILGTFTESVDNYQFNITGEVFDSRGRSSTTISPDITVYGYYLPELNVLSIGRCDKDGNISDDQSKNTYCKITYQINYSKIEGNRLQLRDISFEIEGKVYPATNTYEDNIYTSIFGGDLDPTQLYSINIGVIDSIMKELSIDKIYFNSTLSGKLPLSLLDNLQGKVGVAIGIEATLEDKIDLTLDTYFRDNIKLESNTHINGINKTASIDSYDLIHNSVRVFEEDNTTSGKYGNIIRTLTGKEYAELKANNKLDDHTLYFLSSPIGEQ